MVEMDKLMEIKPRFKKDRKIVFLGGAGVSVASGIPDFRSPNGIYQVKSKYGVPYETMLSHSYFYAHPDTFYEFYWKNMVRLDAKANLAHLSLAKYEATGGSIKILTQNIDGLHQEAGSKCVYELHGSTKRYYCTRCHRFYSLDEIAKNSIPHCQCGAILKPDVVLYGEPLNEAILSSSILALVEADVLIVGGTSLNVYPAAGLIQYFKGDYRLLINQEKTNLDSFFDDVIHDDIGKVLSLLLQ